MEPLFLRACRGEATAEKPVWMMRQAGRYLPEYLEVRSGFKDFLSFVRDSSAAAKVTVQPVNRFGLDAAILFSDILVTLPPLGLELEFVPGKGPQILKPVRTEEDVQNLRDFEIGAELSYTREAIGKTLDLLKSRAPLLGFVGGPLTLASYAIEGGTSKNLQETKKLFYREPEAFETLLKKLAEVSGEYLRLQAAWGCEALVIMDSWAGHLSAEDYGKMAKPYTAWVVQLARSAGVPVLHYANGASHLLKEFAGLGADVLGLDWRTDLKIALQEFPHAVFQGNLDPAALFAPEAEISRRTSEILSAVRARAHIMNLGHGVLPGTPLSGIQAFISAVRRG